MQRLVVPVVLPILLAFSLAACGEGVSLGAPRTGTLEIGAAKGLVAEEVASGLKNPSGLGFSPAGVLTICDSGAGRVVSVGEGGKLAPLVTGFATEFWKLDPDRFELGPLSLLWLADGTLVVSDGGLADGKDRLLYLPPGATEASEGRATPSIPKTSDHKLDLGEGNFTGLSLDPDGKTIWVAGQGADSRTWVLESPIATAGLAPRFSADLNGIEVNSPMDTWADATSVYVLYSGAGGKADGLLVRWSKATGKPLARWTLPGLVDPMGMAYDARSETFLVVDNNWALTHVNHGQLARVRLPRGGGEAEVTVLASRLHGPVSCRFGPDGRLYIACLGRHFDREEGQVIAISGL